MYTWIVGTKHVMNKTDTMSKLSIESSSLNLGGVTSNALDSENTSLFKFPLPQQLYAFLKGFYQIQHFALTDGYQL